MTSSQKTSDQSGATISVDSSEHLGALLRKRRLRRGLGLREAALLAGVGVRFLSEFERGKTTSEIGKVMAVIRALDLELLVQSPNGHTGQPPSEPLSKRLEMDFPYDWSNAHMDASIFIRQVLAAGRFDDLLRLVAFFGFDQVTSQLSDLDDTDLRTRAVGILSRIYQGQLLAQAQAAVTQSFRLSSQGIPKRFDPMKMDPNVTAA